jgi:glutaredoxin
MSNAIYTATGCVRCKITKSFLTENNIQFEEFDFKGEGQEAFGQFYRANRKDIFRDKDGVEFPVFSDGKQIRQGVSVIIGYLISGGRLDGFTKRSLLHGEWIDGFDVSGGDPAAAGDLIKVLGYLKDKRLKIQLNSNGGNAEVLEQLLAAGLGDRLVMEVKGPESLLHALYGTGTGIAEISKSLSLAAKFPEYSLLTTIAPLKRDGGEVSYLTPEEIGETAKLIEEATGSKKNPYLLRVVQPDDAVDEDLKGVEPLPSAAMFKYRSAARRFQVLTEVEK